MPERVNYQGVRPLYIVETPPYEEKINVGIQIHDSYLEHEIFAALSGEEKMLMLDMMANTDCSYSTALMGFSIWKIALTPESTQCYEDGPLPRSLKVGFYTAEDARCPQWLATLFHKD